MITNHHKPIYLNIKTIRFPVTAIASILHRISGFLLFILIGPGLWLLQLSLSSQDKFCKINNLLLIHSVFFKFLLWNTITILGYHIIAGIRHILMDLGFLKQTLSIGKISAHIIFIFSLLLSIYSGILIWNL